MLALSKCINLIDNVIANFFQGNYRNFKILSGVVEMFEYLLTTITSKAAVCVVVNKT